MSSDQLRAKIAQMNALFFAGAVESGAPAGADLVFACTGGIIQVDRVALPTRSSRASFSTIVSDLRRAGYRLTNRKYSIWYDDGGVFARASGYCGQGNVSNDQRAGATNANNTGPSYSITYDDDYYDCGYATLFHELGHNLGAVQVDAPYSTGAYHCYQGQVYVTDVMCYNDGGPRDPGFLVPCGSSFHFDCGHNDYFDAKIGVGEGGGAGSYLDTNWNIGACYMRWGVVYDCPAAPTLNSFSPSSGPVGTLVEIIGSGFSGAAVKFNGTPATSFTVDSPTKITAAVPTGASSGQISVTTSGGTATSAQNFSVTVPKPPTIKSFSPSSGPIGTPVEITGSQFNGVLAVKFKNTPAVSYTVVSPTKITATVPPGATTGPVSVTTSNGTGSSSKKFTVK